ncbi:multidrug effflux MFS transporter [Roseibium sp.]|uniref:multidrug effflux MFS transporter n=1 Tax=Roseibium sp. TaxID=1936156 RepID=UPI003A96FBC9
MPSHISSDPAQRKVPSIAVLIAISTVAPVSMNVYLPSLAGMVDAFETTTARVQLTMSLYFAAVAIAQIFVGPLSDRYGRRPVVLGGLVIYILGSALCLMAPTIEMLVLARLVQAVGACTGIALGRAIVRDLYHREEAASMIGYVTMGMTVGPMIGPVMGGILDASYGWQGGFYLMLGLGTVVLLAAWINLHETNHDKRANGGLSGLWRNYRALAEVPLYWAFALTAMFTSSVYFAYLGGAPYIAADKLGMTPAEMGVYFMIVAVGYIIGNGIAGRASARLGVLRMVLIGSALPTVAVIFLIIDMWLGLFGTSALALFAPMFLVGLGNGICLPNAIAGAVSVRPDLAGAASGLSGSLQIGLGGATSALVAWMLSEAMWPAAVWPMALVMALCIVATWAGCIAAWRFENRTDA